VRSAALDLSQMMEINQLDPRLQQTPAIGVTSPS